MSRVIRGPGARRVVPRDLLDARAQAESTLARARAEALALKAQARSEALAEGRAAAAAEWLKLRADQLAAMAPMEEQVQTLAIAVARRIVGEELALSPERICHVVGEALARARRAQSVTVTVHPEDLPWLTEHREQLAGALADGAGFEIAADPEIGRGGCVVSSELGRLDARIETQLAALGQALAGDDGWER